MMKSTQRFITNSGCTSATVDSVLTSQSNTLSDVRLR